MNNLKKIFPKSKIDTLKEIKIAIDTLPNKECIACFLATINIESNGLIFKSENLNYSKDGLLKYFSKYFSDDPENVEKKYAEYYAKNPEKIANVVYFNRMGNKNKGDGWKYRGRGFIQLTGKNNYIEMSKKIGVDLIENPDLLLDDKYAVNSALCFFVDSDCIKYAKIGDIKSVSGIVNAGNPKATKINHLKERVDSYHKILEIIKWILKQ